MTLSAHILGRAGGDNALYVRIDSGQALTRLLFDCGAGVIAPLGLAEVQAIDAVLFSHLHMDHIGGFDSFFRANYNRLTKPNHIYGPPRSTAILQHRFQGFLWNLEGDAPGAWDVYDIYPNRIEGAHFLLREAFAHPYPTDSAPRSGAVVIDASDHTVEAVEMDHMTPSLAYVVREKARVNVNVPRLRELGLSPGSWLQQLKQPEAGEQPTVELNGIRYAWATLRTELLTTTQGGSVAYCTDFLLDETAVARLVPLLTGCDLLVCESQYRAEDGELARRNHHMTVTQVAELAARAGVGELVLFHVSDRYRPPELQAMLREARAIFPNTRFPEHWGIG